MVDGLSLPDLLADLHVHLLGTGDTSFWLDQLRRMEPATRLSIGPARSPGTLASSLIDDEARVRALLVLTSGDGGVDFGCFAACFHLRQAVAAHEPSALADLIVWNAAAYRREGVRHVEFSIGVSWIAGTHAAALRDGIERAWTQHGVHVGLLLGFDRTVTSPAVRGEAVLNDLLHEMDKKYGLLGDAAHFEVHLAQLKRAREEIGTHGLGHAVLGLDLTGDERFAPYAPFLLPQFVEFIEEQQRVNHRFGIRLHAGELAMPDDGCGYVALRVTEYLLERCWRQNIPTRIGHGMGVALLDAALGKRFNGLYGPTLAMRARRACRETLRTATTEICLTSNRRLVGHAANENPVQALLADDMFPCVLGTDDPQIFAEAGSLRDEFVSAIDAGLITQRSQIDRLVVESLEGSFAPPQVIESLGVQVICQAAEQEPSDAAMAPIRHCIERQRTKTADRLLLALHRRYRRSEALWNLREAVDQFFGDVDA